MDSGYLIAAVRYLDAQLLQRSLNHDRSVPSQLWLDISGPAVRVLREQSAYFIH